MVKGIFIVIMVSILFLSIGCAAVEVKGGILGLFEGVEINTDFNKLYVSIGGSYFAVCSEELYSLRLGAGLQLPKKDIGIFTVAGKAGINSNLVFSRSGILDDSPGELEFSGVVFFLEENVEVLVRCFDSMYIGIWLGGIYPLFSINTKGETGWFNSEMIIPQCGFVLRFGN